MSSGCECRRVGGPRWTAWLWLAALWVLGTAAPQAVAQQGVDAEKSKAAVQALTQSLGAAEFDPNRLEKADFARVPLTKADAEAARTALWKHRAARLRAERQAEHDARELREGELKMPFFYSVAGETPKGGRSLWISLHGGGGAPPRVNDQQWENQKRLYKVEEGVYLAPRAPTNTWNLWHEGHIDTLFQRLIENLVLFEEVSPNRVYVLGYSAGGDGVYQIGPRMADSWAAAAMMAGHPNGVSLLSLRNVPFALQVGGNDGAYNRNGVGREYGQTLEKLHAEDPQGYFNFVKIHEGKGHWMNLEDAAALPWMAKYSRNPVPERVVWKQTGRLHERMYWLAVPAKEAQPDSLVVARRDAQRIVIEKGEKVPKLVVRLDDRLVNLDQPVKIEQGERVLFEGVLPRTIQNLWTCLADRADEPLMYPAATTVELVTPAG